MELRRDEDGLKDQKYLGIDKELISGNVKKAYKTKDVYMIHYERGEEVAKSTGIINEVIKNDKSYTIYHTCDTDHVSSGSPVILYNYK